MKTNSIFLLLMILVGHTHAQYLIIDHPVSGGVNIPFRDTIISSYYSWGCGTSNYPVDLNQDSDPDINFHLECYMGGPGSDYKMNLSTSNDFFIHIDTGYIEYYQYIDSLGQVQDTSRKTPVVRKYHTGDTVHNDQNILATEEKLLHYTFGSYPSSCIYSNVILFLDDTAYIALQNNNGDLYYVKIFVPPPLPHTIEFFYARTDAASAGGVETELSKKIIFPNPATGIISLRDTYDFIEIYPAQGNLTYGIKVPGYNKTLDVSFLRSGFYIVILSKGETKHFTKFLKQ